MKRLHFFGSGLDLRNMNIDHYNSGGIMVKWRISNTHNVSRDISQSMEDLEIEIVELQNLEASTGSRRAF